jgi:hypothetical protein
MDPGRIRLYLLLTLLVITYGCKELYYPEIDTVPNIMSVEGMITNQPGPYNVRLSHTFLYSEETVAPPVDDAIVFVIDSQGNKFDFIQAEPGLYQSPLNMQGTAGETYTLHIETIDGDEFRSRPQTLMPAYQIGSLEADSASVTTSFVNSYGDLRLRTLKGVNATLQLQEYDDDRANIRFNTNVKILFHYAEEEGDSFFCWKEIKKFQGINNINLPAGNQPGEVNRNKVAFLPVPPTGYGIWFGTEVKSLLVALTLYSINDDAYKFYTEVNKQLSSDQSIFSPVPSQITGNIYCVNDARKIATGFFEAASVDYAYYYLKCFNRPEFFITDTYGLVPDEAGCTTNNPPSFWYNIP